MLLDWPQITLIVLMAMAFGRSASMHGKPRTEKWETHYSVGMTLLRIAVWSLLLYFGGFWTGGQ